jgi:hypothetical protein
VSKLSLTNLLTALNTLAGIGIAGTLWAGQSAAGGALVGVAVVLLALLVRSGVRDLGREAATVRSTVLGLERKADELGIQADVIVEGNQRAVRTAIAQGNRVKTLADRIVESTDAMERRILTDLNAARAEAAERD